MEGYSFYGEEIVPTTASGGNENSTLASSNEQEIHRSSGSQRVQHSPYQIEELEKLFKKNDHPGEKEMIDIGRKLNIEEKKAQMERDEISSLKKENEKLKLEILALKEAIKNPICSKCGAQATISDSFIEQQKLKIENERLKEKLSRVTRVLNKTLSTPSTLSSPLPNKMTSLMTQTWKSQQPTESQSQIRNKVDIQRNGYFEQASRAVEEILRLGLVNAPLWKRNKEGGGETLEFVEYVKAFTPCLGTKPPGFVSEATRASSVVPISGSTLVKALLNADQWREMFTGLIGSCTTTEVISQGVAGSRSGALQLMKDEIQVISPLVPVRVLKFVRFVKQAEGLWIVADVSINYGMDSHVTRRCPSGCIIHDMPKGLSKITWIEHVEYNEQLVPDQYRKLIRSGLGFGAKRLISALLRHCEGVRATTSPTLNTHLLKDAKRSLKCLAQRMKSIFCVGICLTSGHGWDLISEAPGRPRIMARKCVVGSSESLRIITSATYSVWIPTNHQHLFGLLLRKDLRCMWDLICHRIATNDMINFPLGQDKTDSNSILILNSNTLAADDQIMVFQENSSDMTGSLIVYATMDYPTVSLLMYSKDTSSVALLPSGISIVPGYGEDSTGAPGGERGSMVTVGYQILQATPNLKTETISTINDLVSRTVLGIKKNGSIYSTIRVDWWLNYVFESSISVKG
ncbi:homeobox-leucine zipper protein ROC5-like [Bidens hawaiensis]|uniref:homeobox-leucine zipper protein ROC5-like n=1 Tax=Bidens hawaiensis TaxID=980011 RepID=UPI00404B18A1